MADPQCDGNIEFSGVRMWVCTSSLCHTGNTWIRMKARVFEDSSALLFCLDETEISQRLTQKSSERVSNDQMLRGRTTAGKRGQFVMGGLVELELLLAMKLEIAELRKQ
jgi:hypothetical protein